MTAISFYRPKDAGVALAVHGATVVIPQDHPHVLLNKLVVKVGVVTGRHVPSPHLLAAVI